MPPARVIVTTAGLLGVMLVAAAGWAWPWPRFIATTGPHSVGTTTLAWTDASRPEITSPDAVRRRTLVAQAWYPAAPGASGPRARYLADPAFTEAAARLFGVPTWLLGGVSVAETPALLEAAPAVGRHPVTWRAPDCRVLGRLVRSRRWNSPRTATWWWPSTSPAPRPRSPCPTGTWHRAGAETHLRPAALPGHRTRHASTCGERPHAPHRDRHLPGRRRVLHARPPRQACRRGDRARAAPRPGPRRRHRGLARGGTTVAEASARDDRIYATLVLEAPLTLTATDDGLGQPVMVITRGADAMRRERDTAGGWTEHEIDVHQQTQRALIDKAPGEAWFVRIDTLSHIDFTDLPVWTPLLRLAGWSGPLDGRRGHQIINGLGLTFFDHTLRGAPTTPDTAVRAWPEAVVEPHR